jgi:hypothetical protein
LIVMLNLVPFGTHTLSFTQFKLGTSIYSNAATRYRPMPIAKVCVPSLAIHACVDTTDLFSSQYAAQHLINIMNNQQLDGELSFLDWVNKSIVC